jgi:hypothetical protein
MREARLHRAFHAQLSVAPLKRLCGRPVATPRTGLWPYQSESVGRTSRLQRCGKEFDEVGGHGLKRTLVLVKTALLEKGLPLSSFLRIAREFGR